MPASPRRAIKIRAGDAVASTGCNNGDDPTVQHSRVNALDRFLDPVEHRGGTAAGRPHAPWNVEVAGQPVVGRSGGGLFSADGMVIGVCNAAEPEDQEGLFAALGSIHAALDQQHLASLYKQAIAPPALVPPVDSTQSALVAVDPFSAGRPAASRVRIPARTRRPDRRRPPHGRCGCRQRTLGETADGEQAVMEEVRRRVHEGPEMVCIIRDRNNPQAKSEVIALDRDWPASANQVARTGQPQNIPQTSLEVPKRPRPILEWDVESGWLHQGPLP